MQCSTLIAISLGGNPNNKTQKRTLCKKLQIYN